VDARPGALARGVSPAIPDRRRGAPIRPAARRRAPRRFRRRRP
jgi:hypothetical protein